MTIIELTNRVANKQFYVKVFQGTFKDVYFTPNGKYQINDNNEYELEGRLLLSSDASSYFTLDTYLIGTIQYLIDIFGLDKDIKCECGADKIGTTHAFYCPKFNINRTKNYVECPKCKNLMAYMAKYSYWACICGNKILEK